MRGIVLGVALAIPVPAAAGPDHVVTLKPAVSLQDAALRVGDLVTVRGGRLPARIASMVVARLPRGAATVDMPAAQAAALVRRRVPALRAVASQGAVVRIRLAAAPVVARAQAACFVSATDLPAGATLTTADVVRTECAARPAAGLRYRVGGLVIVGFPVAAGDYLGRLPALPDSAVDKGAPMTLRARSGLVTIERSVVAMQPARSGGKVFVRDEDGHVFPAPLALSGKGAAR